MNPISKPNRLGGWLTDFTNVAGDAITGTTHIALETGRGAGALVTGDFDRAISKQTSIFDTVSSGIDTTARVAGNLYDEAFDAKQELSASRSEPRPATSVKAYKKGSSEDPSAISPVVWLGIAGLAAKFLLFK